LFQSRHDYGRTRGPSRATTRKYVEVVYTRATVFAVAFHFFFAVLALRGWDNLPEQAYGLGLCPHGARPGRIEDIVALEVFLVTARESRTAREVVELYSYNVWNERDFGLADELFADRVVRHGVNDVITLTREEARQRIEDNCAAAEKIHFTLPVVISSDGGEYAAIVYQADITHKDGRRDGIAGIEVVHVVDGLITEVWNNSYQHGRWQ
jgi:hypothetical protein